MILILSNNFDPSTSDVIGWLEYYGVKWFRINENDRIQLTSINIQNNNDSNISLLINEKKKINFGDISGYWYRRGYLFNIDKFRNVRFAGNESLQSSIQNTLYDEEQNAYEYLHHFLQCRKPNINSFLTAKNNKLYYLMKAGQFGLSIPQTKVCTSKIELLDFYYKNSGRIISKSINEGFFNNNSDFKYFFHTSLVTLKEIKASNETFFPSLFQGYIEKFIELRIFYFHETINCMAIFSQLNQNTRIDLRNFDNSLPNRVVPFSLPSEITQKITDLMKSINLNSGSIDMIVSLANEYYFLEVNPVGQFGMISYPCNFKLEKQIAEFLKNNNETH